MYSTLALSAMLTVAALFPPQSASAPLRLPAVPATTLTAAGQGGELKLSNVRMTIGELGGPRPSTKLLPGDILFIGYDINGLTIGDDGTATYKMGMEVKDAAGKTIFAQAARELNDYVPLRGSVLPARAFVTIGLDMDVGNYTCYVTVEDPKTKAKDTLNTKFEVLKKDFGIVGVYTTYDLRGEISAPASGVVGQTILIHFSVASFTRDPKTKQPNVDFEFQVLDDKGTPLLGKPGKHTQDDKSPEMVEEKAGAFAMRFPLFMSRPGKFTARVTATDKVANKKAVYELPVTVTGNN